MAVTFILIDDEPADLEVMKATLRKVAPTAKCISFLYAEEALWVLKSDLVKTPDYVLIDLNMPVKNGQECLVELRKSPLYKQVPIILATSHLPEIVGETLIQQGATAIFEKPDFAGWPEVMKKILKNKWGAL